MSKVIKQMEMEALKANFQGVRDLVALNMSGVPATTENQVRLSLRKKNIRLQMVKNSLARRVFGEMGMKVEKLWGGPTVLAWGSTSLAELSRSLDKEFADLVKKNPKLKDVVKFKGAVAEGEEITFEQAKTMPTREEAIGRVVMLALAPAGRIAAQLRAPGGIIAGQIKSIGEKAPEEAAAAAG